MIFEINPGMVWGERCSYGIEDIRFHWGKIVECICCCELLEAFTSKRVFWMGQTGEWNFTPFVSSK